MAKLLLNTDRLLLRQFTSDDVDVLVELDSDPDVMHFLTGGQPTPRSEIVDDVLPHWLDYYQRSDHLGFWAAEERTTNAFVGWFHFRPGAGHPNSEPELGYRLRRSAWGKGYATEGSQGLIDTGFAEHGIERVLAETMVVHAASRRVMERCGLRAVRFFRADWPYRIPGDEHGDVEYAITRCEWEERRR